MLTSRRLRSVAGMIALGLVLAVALWAPVPHLGNQGTARVVAAVRERLPGWSVIHAVDTWEGGYAVVASCGSSQIGFQVIPGHGLPAKDAWLQPNDAFTASRLLEVTDYPTYLIWRASPAVSRSLSCQDELARVAAQPRWQGNGDTSPTGGDSAQNFVDIRHRPVD